MSLKQEQDLMARLLTDEGIRRNFFAVPSTAASTHGLNLAEIEDFANSLYLKRLNEVEKLLPMTKCELVDGFEASFRQFTLNFSPVSVKKHLEDAVEFCNFLTRAGVRETVSEIARYEHAKIEFHYYGKAIVFRRLRIDVPAGDGAMSVTEKFDFMRRTKYCLWLNIFNTRRHWIW